MQIPSRFLRVNPSYRGVESQEGWLEIDVKAVDTEGVSKLYVNLDDVARIRAKRGEASKLLDAWDAAFGHKEDEQ